MIWLLLGLNICLLLIYMLTNRKGINFCEPVFLLVVSTIISALFVIMNYHNWNVLEDFCNGVQREHNKKLNHGLPILHKVPPKRDYTKSRLL